MIKNTIIIFTIFLLTSINYAENYADRIVITKSKRIMYVIKNNLVIKEYNIFLGANPIGHKEFEGDKKTPEGIYFVDEKIENSRFVHSLHLSYPNKSDIHRASLSSKSPGANITIHGHPPIRELARYLFSGKDWTDGCIAVSNQSIKNLWKQVRVNTPVIIYP
ncbi:MAG: hypothetical protein CMD90_02795 [Gammaproteobacteria bacterium]|nr:hypothetical protein [Gammaproteobacteria bacterium]|tara:strand:+ start:2304 stop:2792 length:489 start_codon:yes stop_codon:yes gene_type:complete